MKTLQPKHPLPVRCFHWVNAPVLGMMIGSGLLIYWANDVYRIGWGDTTLIRFFPAWFYDALGVPQRLGQGMAWHFTFMWLFVVNGLAYVAYTMASGEWRHLVPARGALQEAWRVVLHDLHLSQEVPPPRKFNAAQQIAYTGVIVMGAGSVATGLAMYKPIQLAWLCGLLGGYEWARWEHFWLTLGYVAFVCLHLTQVARAGWNNLRAMLIGVEVVELPASPAPELTP